MIKNVDLSKYFTLKTKIEAEYFLLARSREELISSILISKKDKLPLLIIGGGSNFAITKQKIKGLVVKNEYFKKEKVDETKTEVKLLVSSGYSMSRLVGETIKQGLEGLEYHLGLPGSIGGAIYMNSKWTRPERYVGDNLVRAYLADQKGNIKIVKHDYFQFDYDYSILQKTKEILLEAVLSFKKVSPEVLKKRSSEALLYRKKTQPFGVSSSGCFFKNIHSSTQKKLNLPTSSAGYLIDLAGLKGYTVGDFYVSEKHANFILNKGCGSPADLKKLLTVIKEKVRSKFGVELEEEVIVV